MANFKSGPLNFGRPAIGRALAISLALHAVLLLQILPAAPNVPSRQGLTASGNSLDATLRGVLRPSVATAPMLPPLSASPAPPPAATRLPRENLSSPESFSATASSAKNRLAANRSGQEMLPTIDPSPASAQSGEGGLDANGLRQYRLSLAAEARRFKHYPQQALAHRWSGTALVRIAIAAGGAPQSVQLLDSSGHEVLDATALEMIRNASLNAVVPPSLRGRAFNVPLPVEFTPDSD